jgi:hypothetical protein
MNKYMMICAILCGFCIGCNNSENYSPPIDADSFDYKYSKTRFKMEGFSDKDSATAARAIMKFNEAQKK